MRVYSVRPRLPPPAAAIAAKVFILAVKTIAKPVSNRFQDYVMNHPIARQRAIKMAQVRLPSQTGPHNCIRAQYPVA